MKKTTMSRRLTKKNKARLEAYWQQQEQIDRYERILDSIRSYRDDLPECFGIYGHAVYIVAQDLTNIIEGEQS